MKTLMLIIGIILFVGAPLLKKILYKKSVGIVFLRRDGKTIETRISLIYIISSLHVKNENKEKRLEKDFEELFNLLDDGVYFTYTHAKYLRAIKHKVGKNNVISLQKGHKNMFSEKLSIAKFEKIKKKYAYYQVAFKIERKKYQK